MAGGEASNSQVPPENDEAGQVPVGGGGSEDIFEKLAAIQSELEKIIGTEQGTAGGEGAAQAGEPSVEAPQAEEIETTARPVVAEHLAERLLAEEFGYVPEAGEVGKGPARFPEPAAPAPSAVPRRGDRPSQDVVSPAAPAEEGVKEPSSVAGVQGAEPAPADLTAQPPSAQEMGVAAQGPSSLAGQASTASAPSTPAQPVPPRMFPAPAGFGTGEPTGSVTERAGFASPAAPATDSPLRAPDIATPSGEASVPPPPPGAREGAARLEQPTTDLGPQAAQPPAPAPQEGTQMTQLQDFRSASWGIKPRAKRGRRK